jgi:hypothetical protein
MSQPSSSCWIYLQPYVYPLSWKQAITVRLYIEGSSGCEEGSGDLQMMPELLNGAFSAKFTQYIQSKRGKEPYNTAFET